MQRARARCEVPQTASSLSYVVCGLVPDALCLHSPLEDGHHVERLDGGAYEEEARVARRETQRRGGACAKNRVGRGGGGGGADHAPCALERTRGWALVFVMRVGPCVCVRTGTRAYTLARACCVCRRLIVRRRGRAQTRACACAHARVRAQPSLSVGVHDARAPWG
eukprot:5276920-Pleurochrysis_carterae.AAC.4